MSDPRSKVTCEKCMDTKLWRSLPTKQQLTVAQHDPHAFPPVGDIGPCPYCCPPPKPKGRHNGHWDDTWMDLTVNISQKSTCSQQNRQVGCVIVSKNNERVLAIGYNGGAKGDTNSCVNPGHPEVGVSKCTCVHAEMNALTKMNPTDPVDKKMYLTLSPCGLCWKLIVNAGIKEVIYLKEYERDVQPLQYLKDFGIKVRKYADGRS